MSSKTDLLICVVEEGLLAGHVCQKINNLGVQI